MFTLTHIVFAFGATCKDIKQIYRDNECCNASGETPVRLAREVSYMITAPHFMDLNGLITSIKK